MRAPPRLTVDCVIFGIDPGRLKVLLVQRDRPPFEGHWALPGGFVDEDEDLADAARRELEEETGVSGLAIEQVRAFGRPGRDPRGHVVSVAFRGVACIDRHPVTAADDARAAAWFPLEQLPRLAFDHGEILAEARRQVRDDAVRRPIPLSAVPPKFTLSQLQHATAELAGRGLDKRNFRRRLERSGLVVPLGERERGVAHRAAELYRFDRRRYRALVQSGDAPAV